MSRQSKINHMRQMLFNFSCLNIKGIFGKFIVTVILIKRWDDWSYHTVRQKFWKVTKDVSVFVAKLYISFTAVTKKFIL